MVFFFFFKQKTAYEMRISDWSSYVCSSDLGRGKQRVGLGHPGAPCRARLAMMRQGIDIVGSGDPGTRGDALAHGRTHGRRCVLRKPAVQGPGLGAGDLAMAAHQFVTIKEEGPLEIGEWERGGEGKGVGGGVANGGGRDRTKKNKE